MQTVNYLHLKLNTNFACTRENLPQMCISQKYKTNRELLTDYTIYLLYKHSIAEKSTSAPIVSDGRPFEMFYQKSFETLVHPSLFLQKIKYELLNDIFRNFYNLRLRMNGRTIQSCRRSWASHLFFHTKREWSILQQDIQAVAQDL